MKGRLILLFGCKIKHFRHINKIVGNLFQISDYYIKVDVNCQLSIVNYQLLIVNCLISCVLRIFSTNICLNNLNWDRILIIIWFNVRNPSLLCGVINSAVTGILSIRVVVITETVFANALIKCVARRFGLSRITVRNIGCVRIN